MQAEDSVFPKRLYRKRTFKKFYNGHRCFFCMRLCAWVISFGGIDGADKYSGYSKACGSGNFDLYGVYGGISFHYVCRISYKIYERTSEGEEILPSFKARQQAISGRGTDVSVWLQAHRRGGT